MVYIEYMNAYSYFQKGTGGESVETGEIIGRGRLGEVYAFGTDKVLKLFFDNSETAHIEQEYRLSQLIQQEELPTARVYNVIDWNDRKGIVYERVHGKTLLHLLFSNPENIDDIAGTCARLLHRIHQCHNRELPSQRVHLIRLIKSANIPEQWKKYALQLLDDLPDGLSICHGDFHPDNIISSPQGPVIIDWSNATHGNAYADYARSVLLLRIATTPDLENREPFNQIRDRFLSEFQYTYDSLASQNDEELERWMIPVAIARLHEHIEGEKEQLITIISAGLERLYGDAMNSECEKGD